MLLRGPSGMEFQTLKSSRCLCRTALFASAALLACSLVALPVSVDPITGSLTISAAWAKNDGNNGNGGGHGNGGGASNGNGGGASNGNGGGASNGNGGGASSNGNAGGASSNGNAGGASSNGNSTGGTPAGADATSSTASASVSSSSATDSSPAIQRAHEQLVSARAELAAANQALGAILSQGDETKIAIARGRVAGAEYAVSSAEMNVTAAQAGISDTETVAASQ